MVQDGQVTYNPVLKESLNGVEDNGSRPPMKTLGILAFMLICALGVAQGALQCFAPMRLRQLQKRFRPSADWTASPHFSRSVCRGESSGPKRLAKGRYFQS